MVMPASIIQSLQAQDWFRALDLQDVYFHIAIHLAHRKYLRFTVRPNHYQYMVLLSEFSIALRIFILI